MAKGDYTKAKKITQKTKQAVYERQKGRSILSGIPISISMCCCHFVGRGEKSGVGYEWNIVGLTPEEHMFLDQNKPMWFYINGNVKALTNAEMQQKIEQHLKENYIGWSREKCSYHKYWEEKDYEVYRNHQG